MEQSIKTHTGWRLAAVEIHFGVGDNGDPFEMKRPDLRRRMKNPNTGLEKKHYESPKLECIGTVRELTQSPDLAVCGSTDLATDADCCIDCEV